MSRIFVATLVVASIFVAVSSSAAPTDAATCQYQLGFKALHDLIPNTVGNCLVDEHHNPDNGDGLQETTGLAGKGGLLVWRKTDNWTAYTDGYRTWVSGPNGLQQRLNTERFGWESAAPAQSTPSPQPAPASTATREPDGFTADVGLDPGHHALDVGASGGGLREYELTLDVALRAKRLLEASGYRVSLSRTNNNPVSAWNAADATEIIRQEQLARIQAVGHVRAFVSIHFNSFGDSSLAGTETYYNGANQGAESRRLATGLQNGVVRRLGESGYRPPNRGVKEDLAAGKSYGHFFSLRGEMPSALVESLFLSNPTEAALLARDATRDAIARGIADGIAVYLR